MFYVTFKKYLKDKNNNNILVMFFFCFIAQTYLLSYWRLLFYPSYEDLLSYKLQACWTKICKAETTSTDENQQAANEHCLVRICTICCKSLACNCTQKIKNLEWDTNTYSRLFFILGTFLCTVFKLKNVKLWCCFFLWCFYAMSHLSVSVIFTLN